MRDMFLSMAAIGAVVAVIYVFIPHDEEADPIQAVDYRVELLTARRAAPYPVAAPADLGAGWKPTSVSYEGPNAHAWHLGYLDPDGQYVAVEQSTKAAKKYATQVSQQAEDTGTTQQVAGEPWQRWKGAKYDALVRTEGRATTVVTGTAGYTRLGEMAAALRTAPPAATGATGTAAPSGTPSPSATPGD